MADSGLARGQALSIAVVADPESVHVRRWVEWFANRGHRVTLLVPLGRDLGSEWPPGVVVLRYRSGAGFRPSQLGMVVSALSARRVIAGIAPDVLQIHYLTVNGFRGWASGFHPRVVTVWGNDVLIDPRLSRRARLLARLSLRSADLVTGISRHAIDAAIGWGARPDRSRVVHFGVNVEAFSPGPDPAELRTRLGLQGRRVLFSPRIIDTLYHHEVVIDALARLPDDLTLVMTRYAASAGQLAAVQQQIGAMDLGQRVLILPALPPSEMPDFYRLADVVVSVPDSDAGPVTLVEALAVGRPIVCSDLPPVREWLGELDPTCLVPVGDAAATADAIRAVLDRPAAAASEFAARGRAAVLERADQRRTMAEIEELYRELLAGRTGASRT
jgi:glycosyltransferase involved in cell wall biosynthesis